MKSLYQFQIVAVGNLNMELLRGRKPLLAAPTGAGKTIIGAELIRQDNSRAVLFIAHRRDLPPTSSSLMRVTMCGQEPTRK